MKNHDFRASIILNGFENLTLRWYSEILRSKSS